MFASIDWPSFIFGALTVPALWAVIQGFEISCWAAIRGFYWSFMATDFSNLEEINEEPRTSEMNLPYWYSRDVDWSLPAAIDGVAEEAPRLDLSGLDDEITIPDHPPHAQTLTDYDFSSDLIVIDAETA